jgi:2-amino-4-hydroxy-6-hydroxymethyldihydropteridine diphosphokinase
VSEAVVHECSPAGEVCYVGLGANLGDRHRAFDRALELMPGVVEARSPRYETVPIGPPQPSFLNAAVRLRTALAPLALLEALLAIERALGRDREQETRWGPRTLDLDVLFWPGRILDEPRLHVPHPRLGDRAFALAPLLDVLAEGDPAVRAAFERQLAALGGRPPLAVPPLGGPSNGPTCSEVVERANAGYPDAPGNSGAIAKK